MRALLVVFASLISTVDQETAPDATDLLLIKEAFRLTEAVQDSVWPGGWGPTPFPVLLVTPEQEFLIAYPRIPPGFAEAGYSTLLQAPMFQRPRKFQTNMLASFPAFGPPSVIVVGRPEATAKTSNTWVLTIVHEHFHQFQMADPDYYSAVEQLDISDGDQTGMWMLNYPFPYQSPTVVEAFSTLSRKLGRLLQRSSGSERRTFWDSYGAFLGDLSERDRRYLGFQVWQEGVARYVELRAAEIAGLVYLPSSGFESLPDFQPFPTAAAKMRAAILDELTNPDLAGRKRVSFYAFGAGLALLLDKDVPNWKNKYLTDKFSVERYITPSH